MFHSFAQSLTTSVLSFCMLGPVDPIPDLDADGVSDFVDACPNTPHDVVVDKVGRPLYDIDEDCDVDLAEYAALQNAAYAASLLAPIVENLTGPLGCILVETPNDMEFRLVVRTRAAASPRACSLAPPASSAFTDSCFFAEVYVLDASSTQQGVGCAFVDLQFSSAQCPISVLKLVGSSQFPLFQSGIPSFFGADEVGGCTVEHGVGVGEWALLATLELATPGARCVADFRTAQAQTASSLIGKSPTQALGIGHAWPFEVRCSGTLYDLDNSGFVDAGDLSLFLECVGQAPLDPICQLADWTCDDAVDEFDRHFFDTAWQRTVCAGGIEIPPCRSNCE